jgi:DNA-binding LacI/PurR family transcriptional regulator
MAAIRSVTKSKQLQELLRGEITSGSYDVGERFYSQNELARNFDVSHVTAREAVGALEQEGLLRRVQGKGTFVRRTSPELRARDMVGLVMRTRGHLYGGLSSEIVRELSDHDHVCLLVECPPGDETTGKIAGKLRSVIGRGPGYLVVDAHSNFPFEVLEPYRGRLICVHRFEGEERLPADYVLCDFHEGGRLAVDHLLGLGHRRVVMLTYGFGPNHSAQEGRIEGARRAFRDRGLPEENLTIVPDSTPEDVEELLREERKPLAVFTVPDFRAKWVYEAARGQGLGIPQEVAVVGFYDTPWCEALHPNLTSVSVREGQMAREVVRIIAEEKDECEDVLVTPELVVRGSCGGSDGAILE